MIVEALMYVCFFAAAAALLASPWMINSEGHAEHH